LQSVLLTIPHCRNRAKMVVFGTWYSTSTLQVGIHPTRKRRLIQRRRQQNT
jgi:hypothetical protein